MKKNKMMRLASSLLVAVLLTTSVISGTFAKYVTEGHAEDEARVAYWGVTVTGGGYLFADTYLKDTNTPVLGGTEPATLSVMSYGTLGDNVVAPGTKNDNGLTVTVSGAPEVAVKVTREATVDLSGWDIETGFYCPLIFKVGNQTVNLSNATSKTEAETMLKDALEGVGTDNEKGVYYYIPKKDISNESTVITWEWPFEVDGDEDAKKAGNDKDTALGNLTTAPEISVRLDITVEQVD